MISRLALVGISLLLSACAPLPIVDQSHFEDKAGNEPRFGERAEASPGGVMFSQYSYWHRSGARITVSNRQPFGLGGLYVSQGDVVYPSRLGGALVFCSDKLLYGDPIGGGFLYTDPIGGLLSKKACFSDRSNDGAFDTVQVAPESTWIERPLSPALPYTKMDIPVAHRGAFKYEIAYDGYSDQTVHLSYREFKGESLDRPAYTQQAKYAIRGFPVDIMFRTVKIQVLNADNNRIIYKIFSGF